MNFLYNNAAITQVHAASEIMDAVCQFAIPAGFLCIAALFALHLSNCISSNRHSTQPTSQVAPVAPQPKPNEQYTKLTCNIDDAPLASQVCHLACAVPQTLTDSSRWRRGSRGAEETSAHDPSSNSPPVSSSKFTIRQLRKMASTHNQAYPSQKIQNLRKLTKSQLIEQLSKTSDRNILIQQRQKTYNSGAFLKQVRNSSDTNRVELE